MNAAEVRSEIEKARAQYAKADRLARGDSDAVDLSPAGEKARAAGWVILRAVLESHPWRPARVKENHR